jgi:hypothetical protein
MQASWTNTYRHNRAKFPVAQLRKVTGQWVAFSPDGQRIVASGSSIAEVSTQLSAINDNLSNVVLERIELESTEINLGAAELQ